VHQFFGRSFADALKSARQRTRGDATADGGFTLIEMMIALFVFALLASGFAITMGGTLKAFQRSRVKTLSEQIASDKLEDARRMPYDDLGNVAGNPIGIVPLTQSQNVGGYTFTVTTDISYVNDPVGSYAIPTFADYKQVVVTVTSAVGAPPVTMSSLVAPPAKPAADKGRVWVNTVNDSVLIGAPMPNISVSLVNGATTRTDTTDLGGRVVFATLPPSPNIPALTPTPGANDYYYLNAPSLPAGYYVFPTSDSSIPIGAASNKFQVGAATSYTKSLSIYKAASVSVILTDNEDLALYDAATLTVTSQGSLGSLGTTGPVSIAAGGLFPAFSTVAGRGIIPEDGATTAYRYKFDISAGGNCVKTDTPVSLKNLSYPSDTSFTLIEKMVGCSYTTVKFHLTDAVDGSPIANTVIAVTGGPIGGVFTRSVMTDSAGDGSMRIQVGSAAQQYTAKTLAVTNGRLASSTNFTATFAALPGSVTVPIAVQWPTKVITVTLKDAYTTNNVAGGTVNITGGPTAGTFASSPATTPASGQVTFTVPCGAPFANYTLTVPPDAAGRIGIPAPGTSVASTCGNVPVTLNTPWTMMAVNVTVTDALTGLTFNNKSGTVTAGPAGASVNIPFTTDGAGKATLSVPAGPSPDYTLTVPAQSGHLAATTTFPPTGPGPVAVAITVPGPLASLTVTVRGATSGLILPLRTVDVIGGPSGVVMSGTTNAAGQVVFNVPTGLAPNYTISTPGGTASVSQAVMSTATASLTVIGL
jgi:prepilin-type N-terminal cleavage/methylation domain-containing protein